MTTTLSLHSIRECHIGEREIAVNENRITKWRRIKLTADDGSQAEIVLICGQADDVTITGDHAGVLLDQYRSEIKHLQDLLAASDEEKERLTKELSL